MRVVTLAVKLADACVHIRGSAQGSAVLSYKLQRVLVGSHCLAKTALHDANVDERDRGAQYIGDVPCPLQPSRALGPGSMRGLQLAGGPPRDPEEARCPARPRWSSCGARSSACWACLTALERRLESAPVRRGTARCSQATQFLLIDDDHVRRCNRAVCPVTGPRPPAISPLASNTPTKPTLSTGLRRVTSLGARRASCAAPPPVSPCAWLASSALQGWPPGRIRWLRARSGWPGAPRRSARTSRSCAGANQRFGLAARPRVGSAGRRRRDGGSGITGGVVERDHEQVLAVQRF
jgi:hypothetical protein